MSDATRQRIAEAIRAKWKDPDYKHRTIQAIRDTMERKYGPSSKKAERARLRRKLKRQIGKHARVKEPLDVFLLDGGRGRSLLLERFGQLHEAKERVESLEKAVVALTHKVWLCAGCACVASWPLNEEETVILCH
jgi:integrase